MLARIRAEIYARCMLSVKSPFLMFWWYMRLMILDLKFDGTTKICAVELGCSLWSYFLITHGCNCWICAKDSTYQPRIHYKNASPNLQKKICRIISMVAHNYTAYFGRRCSRKTHYSFAVVCCDEKEKVACIFPVVNAKWIDLARKCMLHFKDGKSCQNDCNWAQEIVFLLKINILHTKSLTEFLRKFSPNKPKRFIYKLSLKMPARNENDHLQLC